MVLGYRWDVGGGSDGGECMRSFCVAVFIVLKWFVSQYLRPRETSKLHHASFANRSLRKVKTELHVTANLVSSATASSSAGETLLTVLADLQMIASSSVLKIGNSNDSQM